MTLYKIQWENGLAPTRVNMGVTHSKSKNHGEISLPLQKITSPGSRVSGVNGGCSSKLLIFSNIEICAQPYHFCI